ncbi:unnamed protein product, partial [Polarella glacialis]
QMQGYGQPDMQAQQQLQQQQQQQQQQQMQQQQQPEQQLVAQPSSFEAWQGQQAQQQQPPQPQLALPPAAGGKLVVTGCQNPTVGNIVRGEYAAFSDNHGRTVYRRSEQAPLTRGEGGGRWALCCCCCRSCYSCCSCCSCCCYVVGGGAVEGLLCGCPKKKCCCGCCFLCCRRCSYCCSWCYP